MAESTLHPAAYITPGMPYVALSSAMQAFYARRGMWAEGLPKGLLAVWLGDRCPWKPPARCVQHWTSCAGLDAMAADAKAAPPQAWGTGQQKAQFLRRLREAAIRAGEAAAPPAAPIAAPTAAAAAHRATAAVPFGLRIPPEGTAARRAFTEHAWRTLHEFVEFTQSSAYTN
ncbi:MAG: hypothetical protein Q8M01_07225 [Rubrivivax sp.]|nr:hypothetical protein [Rubrivivax sp.]